VANPYSTGRRGVRYGGGTSAQGFAAVKGADDFLALSKRLKAAGAKGLRNELNKAMRDAAKPLIPKVREAARDQAPKGGGLNERLAKKPYRAQTRTGAKTAGVRIVGTKVDPRMNDQGRIAHPTYGHKPTVVQYNLKLKGYFDETLQESGPEIRAEVVSVLKAFADDVTRRRL